ncbi:MAG: amidase [Pseudomonadota bacterium]|nr:amidase [Pseudomonadota bacterium]
MRTLSMFLGCALLAGTAFASDHGFAFDEATVAGLQARMHAGDLDSQALTRAYLERIAAIDDAGPALNAIIELNPDALAEAAARDAERAAGKVRGPMHGIPVLLKDNIDAVPMVNSAGSLALAGNRPGDDAFLVQRLRDAGAVILGKTNLSEWANFRSTRSTSGWSSRGGQTRNPYVLDRNPCGSSAGTGTAIAANLAAVGVGTETDGSIICPAAVAGLVGIKPTVGLVSRDGIIPISISQDTAGPMARTVADAAALLGAMAGADAGDPSGPAASGHVAADYSAFLDADALRGKRIGVLREAMGYHPDVDAMTDASIAALEAAGAEVVDVEVANYDKWNADEYQVLLYEFKDGLNAYLAASGSEHGSLEALIAWNKAHAGEAMPFFAQEIFEQAQAKGPLTEKAYLDAREKARRMAGAEGLLATLEAHKLDALIAPSMSPAWLTDHVLGDHFVGAGYGMAAVAGTPSITVPAGESHGLPLGLTFMGRAWSEPQLIAMAYAFEQATRARKPPQFIPTLEP